MRTITSILLLFITVTTFAQGPKEKQVGDFTTVKVFDLIHISLVNSDENKVIISGENVDDVEIVNKNGILKVRMKIDQIFNGTETFVAVHYTNLKVIDGNEGARIVGNELIEQEKIELKTQEGAVIKVGLNVDKVNIKAVSGGIVETNGRANSQSILINTGGIYDGKNFETKNTEVKIRTGGEAEVNSSNTVDAKVTAGGDIYIYGNPSSINKKTTLGGRIKIVD
jgi:hypothetical protein